MAYDGEGKMSAACTNETGLCTDSPAINRTLYRYDAMGARVEKRTGDGSITRYLYDNGQLAAEYTTAPATESGRRYLTTDHLGTTRVMTDSSGTVTVRRDYFPFGEEISPATLASGNIRSSISSYGDNTISSTTVRFTGKERDAETGLDFFEARYMSAAQGRFTSPDPAGLFLADSQFPQSWNMYTYVQNNPGIRIDPDGLSCIEENGKPVGDNGDGKGCPGAGVKSTKDGKPPKEGDYSDITPSNTNVDGQLTLWDLYQAWHRGELPRTITYARNDPMTIDIRNSYNVVRMLRKYRRRGCPSSFEDGIGHYEAYGESLENALIGPWNPTQFQVGGASFRATKSASGASVTFQVRNGMTASSFYGLNTIADTLKIPALRGSRDNRNGPDGPEHNVLQIFSWTVPDPCAP